MKDVLDIIGFFVIVAGLFYVFAVVAPDQRSAECEAESASIEAEAVR